MKLVIGSDEQTHLTQRVIEMLLEQEHDVLLFGPLDDVDYP